MEDDTWRRYCHGRGLLDRRSKGDLELSI
jgi:hypothetical protein